MSRHFDPKPAPADRGRQGPRAIPLCWVLVASREITLWREGPVTELELRVLGDMTPEHTALVLLPARPQGPPIWTTAGDLATDALVVVTSGRVRQVTDHPSADTDPEVNVDRAELTRELAQLLGPTKVQ